MSIIDSFISNKFNQVPISNTKWRLSHNGITGLILFTSQKTKVIVADWIIDLEVLVANVVPDLKVLKLTESPTWKSL